MRRKLIIISLLIALGASVCRAQEEPREVRAGESFHPHHQLALVLSHVHIFEGVNEEGKRDFLSVPAWGLDYNFVFHEKWSIGLHTDITVEKFKVEKNLGDREVIERSYPVAPALMGIYKPGEHWNFQLGLGGEFSTEENFFLTRACVEYGAEIRGGWEVFGTLGYDIRFDAYDTWLLGIGISKAFGE